MTHRRRRRPPDRDRRTSTPRRRTVEDDIAKHIFRVQAKAGAADPAHQARELPHGRAAVPGARARSTAASAPSTASRARASSTSSPSSALARRVLGALRRRDRGPAGHPAGRALEPVPARPGRGPRRRPAASPAKGVTRLRLRRPLLLGHRDLRAARSSPTPRPSWPATRCGSGYSMLDAAAPRARELNERGALFPWRTINGEEASRLLRGRHRAVPHQRRRRLRAQPVRRRHRRRRLPQPRGPSTSSSRRRGMWADLGFWREQRRRRRSTSTASPGPTSTRPSSTTTSSRT